MVSRVIGGLPQTSSGSAESEQAFFSVELERSRSPTLAVKQGAHIRYE
jgi:hypothetical protein